MGKFLDKDTVITITDLRKKGLSYVKIAEALTREGYTSRTGKPICDAQVSKLMIANGVRCLSRPTKGLRYKKVANGIVSSTPIKEVTKENTHEDFMLDVLVNKTLTKTQKVKILEALL